MIFLAAYMLYEMLFDKAFIFLSVSTFKENALKSVLWNHFYIDLFNLRSSYLYKLSTIIMAGPILFNVCNNLPKFSRFVKYDLCQTCSKNVTSYQSIR